MHGSRCCLLWHLVLPQRYRHRGGAPAIDAAQHGGSRLTHTQAAATCRFSIAATFAGIVAARVPKKVLAMAGIQDCYTCSSGHTRTLGNFVKARLISAQNGIGFFSASLALHSRSCPGLAAFAPCETCPAWCAVRALQCCRQRVLSAMLAGADCATRMTRLARCRCSNSCLQQLHTAASSIDEFPQSQFGTHQALWHALGPSQRRWCAAGDIRSAEPHVRLPHPRPLEGDQVQEEPAAGAQHFSFLTA